MSNDILAVSLRCWEDQGRSWKHAHALETIQENANRGLSLKIIIVSHIIASTPLGHRLELKLDEEEERRKRRREKNKVAAARCRNKKKERTEFLQRGMGCKARPVGFPVAVSEDVWSVCCRPWVFTTALPGGFRVCVLAMYPVPIVTNAGIQDSRVHWAPAMPQSSVLGSPSPSSDLPRISCQVVTSKACAQSCSENQLCNLYEGQDPLAIRWAQTSMCWLGYELKGTYICQEWEIRVTPV
ncbi:jun dimerization protein 2 isoform X3 [Vulpes lagopus]|uniref:jun dimerization protein 2 isoform X3 n=1 Tax=Vulpes lagopus TaxID=494514 RepID=UPI001BC9A55B|nr:jun dimerization protein 2 isoform X3 [Vulpes lagopus]